jgi:hypothetical protein
VEARFELNLPRNMDVVVELVFAPTTAAAYAAAVVI